MEKIIDFIKSIFYYRQLKRYFKDKEMDSYDKWGNSIKYALWHSQILTKYPIMKLKE